MTEKHRLTGDPPHWSDIWVCSGCGKRSTDTDLFGLWRWLGDRYEHGCVGSGQSRIYEPARFFGKVGQEKLIAADPRTDDRARFIRETAAGLLGMPMYDDAVHLGENFAKRTYYYDRDAAIGEATALADALFSGTGDPNAE